MMTAAIDRVRTQSCRHNPSVAKALRSRGAASTASSARQPKSASGSPNSSEPSQFPRAKQYRFSITSTFALLLLQLTPLLAFAQASPFQTGATALQTNLLTIMTPVAIILVIALGIAAMVNRISWGWCAAAIVGIAIAFGAPQMVAWVRGMFGV
jgi:type IV secretion system protein VirB2